MATAGPVHPVKLCAVGLRIFEFQCVWCYLLKYLYQETSALQQLA